MFWSLSPSCSSSSRSWLALFPPPPPPPCLSFKRHFSLHSYHHHLLLLLRLLRLLVFGFLSPECVKINMLAQFAPQPSRLFLSFLFFFFIIIFFKLNIYINIGQMLCCFVANVHRRKVKSITFLSREREREREWKPLSGILQRVRVGKCSMKMGFNTNRSSTAVEFV